MELTELIARAPWREAVTYRDTWPHEYVLLQKDDQRELLEAVCQRLGDGEGVPSRFFAMCNAYLFIGDYNNPTPEAQGYCRSHRVRVAAAGPA